jgi:prefoldin subunit 5
MRISVGTEIQTFNSLKDMADYLETQTSQYKAIYEDYSQWLGTLLRSCEGAHKNEDWFQKSTALQKNIKMPQKKAQESKNGGKKNNSKGKRTSPSCWIESGNVLISSVEQGEIEMLFEAIDKINTKIQEMDKFKASVQQLERIGLGKNTNYVVYLEDDVPKKIFLQTRNRLTEADEFKFEAQFSSSGLYESFSNE